MGRPHVRPVGIRFKRAGKIYTFDAGDTPCGLGDWVVVETERGMALGQVVNPARTADPPSGQHLKKVLRTAEDRDILRYEQNCELEGYAYQYCIERIRERNLPMKLVDVEYLFDGSKAIFYFTSEGRVDFRELVRELARQFHTRIEMRQIGVRDEAKLVGGVGSCGRELCCATWLTDFRPIGVRMAKEQNLALNPTKISGICGRLMCCLAYEHAMYRDLARGMPKMGKRVDTPRGEGKVIRRNVLEGTFVILRGREEVEVTREEYQSGRRAPDPAPAPAAGKDSEAPPAPARKRTGRRDGGQGKKEPAQPRTGGAPKADRAEAARPSEPGRSEKKGRGGRRRRPRRKGRGGNPSARKPDGD